MKKFYEEIKAEFIVFEVSEVLNLSGAGPTMGDGEHIIGGSTGIGNI